MQSLSIVGMNRHLIYDPSTIRIVRRTAYLNERGGMAAHFRAMRSGNALSVDHLIYERDSNVHQSFDRLGRVRLVVNFDMVWMMAVTAAIEKKGPIDLNQMFEKIFEYGDADQASSDAICAVRNTQNMLVGTLQ
jgi:hypothetical protein